MANPAAEFLEGIRTHYLPELEATGPLRPAYQSTYDENDLLRTSLRVLITGARPGARKVVDGLVVSFDRIGEPAEADFTGLVVFSSDRESAVIGIEDIDDLGEPYGVVYRYLHPNFPDGFCGVINYTRRFPETVYGPSLSLIEFAKGL